MEEETANPWLSKRLFLITSGLGFLFGFVCCLLTIEILHILGVWKTPTNITDYLLIFGPLGIIFFFLTCYIILSKDKKGKKVGLLGWLCGVIVAVLLDLTLLRVN